METWFSLTPEQRTVARDQYRNLQRIPPEQREALRQKWITYQELPSEEKQRFTEAAKKPAVKPAIPKIGAPPIKPLSAPPPPRPAKPKIIVKTAPPTDEAQQFTPVPSLPTPTAAQATSPTIEPVIPAAPSPAKP